MMDSSSSSSSKGVMFVPNSLPSVVIITAVLLFIIGSSSGATATSAAGVVRSKFPVPVAFVSSPTVHSRRIELPQQRRFRRRRRQEQQQQQQQQQLHVALADFVEPEEKEKKKRDHNHNNDEDDWTPAASGGFLPNFRKRVARVAGGVGNAHAHAHADTAANKKKKQQLLLQQVETLEDYKRVVADERNRMVCVRFYAPWCRACKAAAPAFMQLAADYNHHPNGDGDGGNANVGVKFVEVPLKQSNAFLHQGLGIPSLPYAHLYHPQVGLVEERKLNKKVFGTFRNILKSYVDGQCPVKYDDDDFDEEEEKYLQ